jgi:hypothetical protein
MRTAKVICLATVLGIVGWCGLAQAQEPTQTLRPETIAPAAPVLEGEWRIVTLIVDGKPNAVPAGTKIVFRRGRMSVFARGQELDLGAINAVGLQDVDIVSDRGTERGLCFVDGATLMLFVAMPGKDRPADFASPGPGGTVMVLEQNT